MGLSPYNVSAAKVIDLGKAMVLADHRFLGSAMGQLKPRFAEIPTQFATEGSMLLINGRTVCLRYLEQDKPPVHDLLHTFLHCLFLHPFVNESADARLWDLACDIAVEARVRELAGERHDGNDLAVGCALIDVKRQLSNGLTAEAVYRALCEGKWVDQVNTWSEIFYHDTHGPWRPQEGDGLGLPGPSEAEGAGDNGSIGASTVRGSVSQRDSEQGENAQDSSATGNSDDDGRNPEGDTGQGTGAGHRRLTVAATPDAPSLTTVQFGRQPRLRARWERVARTVAMDLRTYSVKQGMVFDSLAQELDDVTQRRVDYKEFLRSFAVSGEVMRVSDDEFDPVFYTYGLSLYGNLPLIEPLEQRIEKRVREFVIVIDTSGSTSGYVVKKFLDATFSILKDTESFFERVHVRIIQCDCRVQSDDVITNPKELEQWARSINIRGHGGTDFRPAFEYVDRLVDNGTFEDLGGLVYFTDGYGTYPDWAPTYKVAFVYHNKNYPTDGIPPWAAQVVLKPNEL